MTEPKLMKFFLEPALCDSAKAGTHNFIAKIAVVLEKARFRVEYCEMSEVDEGPLPTHSLVHMKRPVGVDGLVFRRVYHYPFWQIENTHERWNWQVAKATFAPKDVDEKEAQRFYRFWQKRLFKEAPLRADRQGFVYVPLQGRLLDRRSFQSCSPLEMIEHCLAQDPDRPVIATLHPKETYSQPEIDALEALEARNPRLEIRVGQMSQMLEGCDYIVTQNSSAAFAGYFFGKPALLFGKIDFHHIAVTADMENLDRSFAEVQAITPDYARYLWWFWQDRSINAGRPDAEAKIAARLRHFGWPVK